MPHVALLNRFTETVLSVTTGSLEVVVVEEDIDVLLDVEVVLSEEEVEALLGVETILSLVDTLVVASLVGTLISLVLSTLLLSLTDELLCAPHATERMRLIRIMLLIISFY